MTRPGTLGSLCAWCGVAIVAAVSLPGVGCAPVGLDVEYHALYADQEPPLPAEELVGPEPGVGYVWTPGYWYWSGMRYIWVPGSWRRPPAVGHVWVRGGWVVVDGRYRYVGGYWRSASRVPRYHYVHPAPRYRRR